MSACAQDKDPYDVMRWLKEIEARKVHRRGLVNPGPWFVLVHRKIATACVATLSGEIEQTIQHLRAKRAVKDRLLGGREMLLER